ncbi:MAG: hypothetical protein ACEPOZ_14000 [Marinifilaceae bacterium]
MKRIMFVLLGLLMISGMAQAQEKGKLTTEERTEILTEWMQEELELTQDQLPQVKEIIQEFSKGMEEVVKTTGFRAKWAKFRSKGKERDEALEKVLTPEQYDTFTDIKGDMRKVMKERGEQKKKS